MDETTASQTAEQRVSRRAAWKADPKDCQWDERKGHLKAVLKAEQWDDQKAGNWEAH